MTLRKLFLGIILLPVNLSVVAQEKISFFEEHIDFELDNEIRKLKN